MSLLGNWFGPLDNRSAREEAAAFNDRLASAGAIPPATIAEILRLRKAPTAVASESCLPFEDHEIEAPGGPIPVRLFLPPSPRGGCIVIHGGGWMTGGHDEEDAGTSAFAESCDLVVATIGYRLAPENPYPAALDDCEAATVWLLARFRQLGFDRVLMSGGSAGAHLVVGTLIRLRDRHGLADTICGAVLAAGVYDLSMTPSQRRWDRNLVLSASMLHAMYDSYTPGLSSEERRDPDISPMYADLSGLPPAVFSVGTADPFLDDSLFLAARWRVAGNQAELHVLPEGIHGFASFQLEITNRYNQANRNFIERVVPERTGDSQLSDPAS